MFELEGALDGMGTVVAVAAGDVTSAMGAFGSLGGVVDIIAGFVAAGVCVGCCICVDSCGKSCGGGYFWKKRKSRGGRALATSIGEVIVGDG